MLKESYELLKARLVGEVPELLEVEWYHGQYLQQGGQYQIVSPAAYIEFLRMPTEETNHYTQVVDMNIRIHLVQECILEGGARITDAALDHVGLVNKVYKALSNYEGILAETVIFNSLKRTDITPDHNLNNLLVTKQSFNGQAFDYSAHPQWIEKVVGLNVIK